MSLDTVKRVGDWMLVHDECSIFVRMVSKAGGC